ncbi:tRNA lysidine(34) synthetase TilS [Pseudoalteromonas sp. SSDWG2]|uniref:tRNA lysidine(34) synthetase TilS n=1 Tax=Pseudoalteromonas sp. SSDWG2 TaxID=3139391 RepID=UPI003BA9424A
MQSTFDTSLSQLLARCDNCQGLAVALSGGLDSMALLALSHDYAARHNLPICAVHIHHGLSANADSWLTFAKEQCQRLGITLYSARVQISEQTRKGIEAKAREARYNKIDELVPQDYALVLGQHQDDQVETFFLRLKRGAGLKGLGAMHDLATWQSRVLLRPLLHVSRADLEQFVAQQKLSHIHDESNDDSRYDRNFLRNDVLPLLNQRFHGFSDKVAQTVTLLQAQQQLLDDIAQSDLESVQHDAHSVSLDALLALGESRYLNAIRLWLQHHDCVMPSQIKLNTAFAQFIHAREDAQPSITFKTHGNLAVDLRRYNGLIYLVTCSVEPVQRHLAQGENSVQLDAQTQLTWWVGNGVRAAHASEQITIRYGCLNSRIRPHNKPYSNKLSHWLKELKVPPWQRQTIPLIFYDESLVAVVGYFYNHDFLAAEGIQWQITTQINT